MPVFPHFPVKIFALPTSRCHQNVDSFPWYLAVGNWFVLSALTFVIPPCERLSLQKNNSTFRTSSHQNSQKRLGIPRIPLNPTCSSHQKAGCRTGHLRQRTSSVIMFWPLVIPPTRRLSLQKVNFSVSATLKESPGWDRRSAHHLHFRQRQQPLSHVHRRNFAERRCPFEQHHLEGRDLSHQSLHRDSDYWRKEVLPSQGKMTIKSGVVRPRFLHSCVTNGENPEAYQVSLVAVSMRGVEGNHFATPKIPPSD
jgi:hypothetical protein